MKITEKELRDLIYETIQESVNEDVDEVNFFRRAGNAIRNAYDTAKTQVGGAAAGLKAGLKYGGGNAAAAGRNDYLAKKNSELAASRKQECDAAIEEFRNEYCQKVGELNKWKASEIAQIKKMYGADAFSKASGSAQERASAARADQARFWNGGNQQQQQLYRNVAEAVERAMKKVLG